MSDWKNGDVAMVLCSDGEWRIATYWDGPERCDAVPLWRFPDGSLRRVDDSQARRVLVIDPSNKQEVREFIGTLDDMTYSRPRGTTIRHHLGQERIRNFTNALNALIEPPRIDQPEVWGVVQAGTLTDRMLRKHWVRHPDGEWKSGNSTVGWGGLVSPTLIRDGVS